MKAVLHDEAGVCWRNWPRPNARPVLALHCSLSHGGEWAGLAEARPDLNVTAPDLVGHGRMAVWDGTSDLHRGSTDIAIRLAERIGHGSPIDLIGHSFGGTVALRLALERPDLVRRLVLVEPVIFGAAKGSAIWPAYMTEHSLLEAVHAKGDAEATTLLFLSNWGSGAVMSSLPPGLRRYMIDRIALVMALDAGLMQDAYRLLTHGRLENLARKVLLVQGADSPAVIGAIHETLANRLPDASQVRILGARHMLPITHASEVSQVIGDFLAR
jgi:lipase